VLTTLMLMTHVVCGRCCAGTGLSAAGNLLAEDVWAVEVGEGGLSVTIVDCLRASLVAKGTVMKAECDDSLLDDNGFYAHEMAAVIERAVRRADVESDPAAVVVVVDRALTDVSASEALSAVAKARGLVVDGNHGTGDGSLGAVTLIHRTLALCAACARMEAEGAVPPSLLRQARHGGKGGAGTERCHALLHMSVTACRVVVFLHRQKPKAVPVIKLMGKAFSCGAMPSGSPDDKEAYVLVELQPMLEQVLKYAADLGLPPPVFAAVGPRVDDPALRRAMDAKGLAMWLPGPSHDGIDLVAYGAACLASQDGNLIEAASGLDLKGLLTVEPFFSVRSKLREVARHSRQVLKERLLSHDSATNSGSVGSKGVLPIAGSLHSFTTRSPTSGSFETSGPLK
jgi:predicted RNA-binding protein